MQFEYKTLPLHGGELDNSSEGFTAKLNEIGKSELEPVSVLSQNGLGSSPYNVFGITQKLLLVLERPIVQGESK